METDTKQTSNIWSNLEQDNVYKKRVIKQQRQNISMCIEQQAETMKIWKEKLEIEFKILTTSLVRRWSRIASTPSSHYNSTPTANLYGFITPTTTHNLHACGLGVFQYELRQPPPAKAIIQVSAPIMWAVASLWDNLSNFCRRFFVFTHLSFIEITPPPHHRQMSVLGELESHFMDFSQNQNKTLCGNTFPAWREVYVVRYPYTLSFSPREDGIRCRCVTPSENGSNSVISSGSIVRDAVTVDNSGW